RFGDLLDRVGKLPPAPVLDPVHLAFLGFAQRLVTLDDGTDLLALVGAHVAPDFVLTRVSPCGLLPGPRPSGARRCMPCPFRPRQGTGNYTLTVFPMQGAPGLRDRKSPC